MSQIVDGKIVLQGTAAQAIPGFSLYLTFETESSRKDVLYEFAGEVPKGARSPFDLADDKLEDADLKERLRWDVFESYGRILKTEKGNRTRKLLGSGLSADEALTKIRDDVLRNRKGYVVQHPPLWWNMPEPDLRQVDVMLARGVDGDDGMAKLDALYDQDEYILELKYDGHRAKAHFHAAAVPQVRFDSRRRSDVTGFFSENTDQLPHLSGFGMPWQYQEFVRKHGGAVLDGEIIHDKGIYAVGSVMGALPEKAISFQKENGWTRFIVFDCVYVRDVPVVDRPWKERRALAEELVTEWKKHLPDPEVVQLAPFWSGKDKREIRRWAFENGFEGTILKKQFSKYLQAARTWDWVKDKKQKRFTCIVTGFENSESEAYGPKGWIKCVKVSQHKDGVWEEVASVGSMDVETRKWFSENRQQAHGMVVEIEAQEQNKETRQLRHPRFIAFRSDKVPADCFIGQEG